MTERETQPTADDKYTVHSIYDPHKGYVQCVYNIYT